MFKTQTEMEAIAVSKPQMRTVMNPVIRSLKTHTFAMTQRYNTNEKKIQCA